MKKNTGFTLIEVLVSMLVLAVGLLGLAGLQARSLGNNANAYNRSQATQLAYDLADRMRANLADAQLYAGSTYVTVVPAEAAAQAGCPIPDLADPTIPAGCTAAQMAQDDLFLWNSDVTTLIAGGQGTITAAGSVYTITVTWDDDKDASTVNLNFQMSFQL